MKTASAVAVVAALTLWGATARLCEAPVAPRGIAPDRAVHARVASALAVVERGVRDEWWRSDAAPARWPAALPTVAGAVTWRRVSAGVDWGELALSGAGEAWRIRVILVRVDPRRVRFRMDTAFRGPTMRAAWSIDRAPHTAVVAVNAGQFVGSLPWGWVVLRGREFLAPGRGPLATAVAIDSAGAFHWTQADGISRIRDAPWIVAAFESYPTLLEGDGDVPALLRPNGTPGGIDLEHRDARLAVGQLRDGRVLLALTRFDALGGTLDFVPFGLTTPEMSALMGALGCRTAVALDGGISSQLLIRDAAGVTHRWPGVRRVPLGLVVVPRDNTR